MDKNTEKPVTPKSPSTEEATLPSSSQGPPSGTCKVDKDEHHRQWFLQRQAIIMQKYYPEAFAKANAFLAAWEESKLRAQQRSLLTKEKRDDKPVEPSVEKDDTKGALAPLPGPSCVAGPSKPREPSPAEPSKKKERGYKGCLPPKKMWLSKYYHESQLREQSEATTTVTEEITAPKEEEDDEDEEDDGNDHDHFTKEDEESFTRLFESFARYDPRRLYDYDEDDDY